MVETVTISKKDYENLLKSNQKTIDELNKFKTEFDAYKKQSEQEIRLLKMEKEFLEEKLRLRRAEQYGRKSEQKEYVQMSIFDEVEGMNEIAAVDDKLEEVAEEIATVKNTPHKRDLSVKISSTKLMKAFLKKKLNTLQSINQVLEI